MSDFDTNLPLGKPTSYAAAYDPGLLCPVPRRLKREEIGLYGGLPFHGFDLWNAFELSWLTPKGKPVVAIGEFRFPCESPNLVESKSFKLYLNSFNQTRCPDIGSVATLLKRDLGQAVGAPIDVRLLLPEDFGQLQISEWQGRCIDHQDLDFSRYALDPGLLEAAADEECVVEESLFSHLLKSNCLVTRQPDWGSLMIRYHGPKINEAALLRYLVSFRQHNEFHEQCVERVFVDLLRFCRPRQLTVYARYTRRGGLDINPFRSNFEDDIANTRLARQ
ncbi:MAG TPA: NADPH-dependent 7-cyano-7-deazaguanine reductase QueF [Desulfuromonadales bacterium]|nr:NADPH-dependent 7-cyano-7-deazaguanine reductase QueF [Desulfuromonadales bacterium]